MQSSYITSAQQAQQLPALDGHPELAFVGRSNCGKSSLLNALLGRKSLARTSRTPGRTAMINFFSFEFTQNKQEVKYVFADLPGYGFSAIGRDVRKHWQDLVDAYLQRPQILHLLFLADARRAGDLGEEDDALLRQLAGKSARLTVVLTKADKLRQKEQSAARQAVAARLKDLRITDADIAMVSTHSGAGIDQLKAALGLKT